MPSYSPVLSAYCPLYPLVLPHAALILPLRSAIPNCRPLGPAESGQLSTVTIPRLLLAL